LATLLIWQAAFLCGQVNTATLSGRVLDSSGSTVAGADLTVLQVETRIEQKTRSDDSGNYQFSLLPPGRYELSARHPGFKIERREGIILVAGDRVRIEIGLAPGEVTETVSVTANSSQVNPESSALGSVVG